MFSQSEASESEDVVGDVSEVGRSRTFKPLVEDCTFLFLVSEIGSYDKIFSFTVQALI